jgi:tight adherence protein B
MNPALPVLLVGSGVAGLVVGVLMRGRERHEALAAAIGMPAVGASGRSALAAADRLAERVDAKGGLRRALARAHVGIGPGAFLVAVAAASTGAAFLAWVLLGLWLVVPAVLVATPMAASAYLKRRVTRRQRAFVAQLPDALTLVASSLSSGHTLLRAFQLLCEEADQPIAGELGRVVREAQLGAPLLDALDDMADRVGVADLLWVVQAIRIQQEAGGKLAELLHTLAGFMRSREEVRREVLVLTAEGRMSMWVLGLLPVGLLVAMQVIDPTYVAPLFRGWGLFVLSGAAASVVAGVAIIRRMVQIEV